MKQPTTVRVVLRWQFLVLWVGVWVVASRLAAAPACAPGHVLVCFKPAARTAVSTTPREGQLRALSLLLGLPTGARLSETPLVERTRAKRAGLGEGAGPRSERDVDVHLDRFLYLTVPPGLTPAECVRRLENHPLIDYVEPDWIGTVAGGVPVDDTVGGQWHHQNSEFPAASIQTPRAWEITRGSSNVVVAVLDTGLAELPGFVGRTVPGYNFAYTNEVTLDDNGHGTQITALLAGGAGGDSQFRGVDWHCRIMPLKVFDANNKGLYSSWAQAIDYAVSNGCHVINLSGGGSEFSRAVQRSITNAIARGVIFVTAAGNDSATNLSFPGYLREPITVGATGVQDQRASFSNRGPQLDLVAPGADVATVGLDGEPTLARGTSFAAPLVSGVCALLVALRPGLTQADARLLLCAGAEDEVGGVEDLPGFDTSHGWGRLNAYNSLMLASTRLDEIRRTHGRIQLSWRGPSNAAGKRPFQVAFRSGLDVPWVVSLQTNSFSYSEDRVVWDDELPSVSTVGGAGFYRIQLRVLP